MATMVHINSSKATAATINSSSILLRQRTVSLSMTSTARDTVPTPSNR